MCPAIENTGGAKEPRRDVQSNQTPLFIGDALHVLNQQVHKAIISGDGQVISQLVQEQLANGAGGLSVNLGPGREAGKKTPWLVETIRALTDVPLFFSANIMDHASILEEHGSSLVINAVTANPDDLEKGIAIAKECDCSLVVLLVRSGASGSIAEKIQVASEVLEKASVKGVPPERIYLDPVLSCRHDPVAWHVSRGVPDISSVVETVGFVRQLDKRVKTIVALGNGSEGMEKEKRSGFHGRALSLLTEVGLDAVLFNCLDKGFMSHAEAYMNDPNQSGQIKNRMHGDSCSAM